MSAIRKAGRRCAVAIVLLATALLAAACAPQPQFSSGAARDAAYGIPPGSVPHDEMRPDGLLINGLLPLPPNSGS